MAEQAGRLAGLPEPMTVAIKRDEWPPHEGWRVMLVLDQRVVSALLPAGELSVERLALTLRLMAAGNPVS
jgi:hypothetical protein